LVCGVLVESVKIDLVATSLFLLLDFIIIIILFALGFRFQRRRSIIARHFWKWIEDFVVTFFWSSSSRSCTSFSKNWPRAEGRRSDWREFFFWTCKAGGRSFGAFLWSGFLLKLKPLMA
jgi:hypothetical protein